jgi:REP element-mobilizing transposase RayT
MRAPAPRLTRTDYVGRRSYLLTVCTYKRLPLLATAVLVEPLLVQFRRCATAHHFAIHAYAFMPDHVHFVIEGQNTTSDVQELVRVWKSQTAFTYKRATRQHLWRRSFYDRVMRDPGEIVSCALYVLDNPAHAVLPNHRREYPFIGSDTINLAEVRRGRKLRQSPVGAGLQTRPRP